MEPKFQRGAKDADIFDRARRQAADASGRGHGARIRGLGFIGLRVLGSHHGPHHLAIAQGDAAHGAGHSGHH